jgi:hypothetical protein
MGKVYDYCQKIQEHIDASGQDVYKARGAVALRVGFLITLVKPTDPDDPERIEALKSAAKDLFGLSLD